MNEVATMQWSLSVGEILLLVAGAVLTLGVVAFLVISLLSGDDR